LDEPDKEGGGREARDGEEMRGRGKRRETGWNLGFVVKGELWEVTIFQGMGAKFPGKRKPVR